MDAQSYPQGYPQGYPLMLIDPRVIFGGEGPNAFDVDDQEAFRDVWSGPLSVSTDFFREYMYDNETDMSVRWDVFTPALEVMIREGDSYTVIATFSWVRTVIADEVSVACYDCGEDALHISSPWGYFLIAGEGDENVTIGHGLAVRMVDVLLGMGHTVTVHAVSE